MTHAQPRPRFLDASQPLLVSAPGKIILYGEHAVVHGKTAVAASLDLRCYGLVLPATTSAVTLHLPDIGFSHSWPLSTLPWDLVPRHPSPASFTDLQPDTFALEKKLLERIDDLVLLSLEGVAEEERRKTLETAACAFLVLYMNLAKGDTRLGQTFLLRASLPRSAGLGSSSAFSVCLASSILLSHSHVPLPAAGHDHEHAGAGPTISAPSAALVNAWAFVGEKVIHGNPSGIDNLMSTHGGALSFVRANKEEGREAQVRLLKGFKSLRFLLVDTRVPRDTKALVAKVGEQKANEPGRANAALDEIHSLSEKAVEALSDAKLSRAELTERLGALMDRNHALLASLQVSHPRLEEMRALVKEHDDGGRLGLKAKLTGAGGGGCGIVLVPDAVPEAEVRSLVATLHSHYFTVYESNVGGAGFGMAVPRNADADDGLLDELKRVGADEVSGVMAGLGAWSFA